MDRKARIEARKVAAAVAREKRAQEKVEKAEAMALRRQERAAEKAQLAEERAARKKAKKAFTTLQTLDKSPKKAFTKRKRATTIRDEVVMVEEEEEVKIGLQGRSIRLPCRYKN